MFGFLSVGGGGGLLAVRQLDYFPPMLHEFQSFHLALNNTIGLYWVGVENLCQI